MEVLEKNDLAEPVWQRRRVHKGALLSHFGEAFAIR